MTLNNKRNPQCSSKRVQNQMKSSMTHSSLVNNTPSRQRIQFRIITISIIDRNNITKLIQQKPL